MRTDNLHICMIGSGKSRYDEGVIITFCLHQGVKQGKMKSNIKGYGMVKV